MNEHRIKNSLEPVNSRDLTTKYYVDHNFLNRITGGQIGADLDMRGNAIKFLKLDNTDSSAARVAELKLKLNRSGDGMTGDLSMNNHFITNLKSPTGDNDAVNRGYLNQKISESHINTSDKTNVFKYLNDPNQTSSERNITVNSFGDWINSPHKYNKRAYDVTLQRHSGADSYDSKIGINLYSAGAGKFTLTFEFHNPTTMSNINITASVSTAIINKQTQRKFNDYTKVIIQVDNSSLQTPDYLYYRITGVATQAAIQTYIIIYGVHGLVDSVDSDIYDDVFYYLNENFEDDNGDMKIKKDVNLDNHKITNLSDGINSLDCVNKRQLDAVSSNMNDYVYRNIFDQYYSLTETSRFRLVQNVYGAVIQGVKPRLYLGTDLYVNDYDRVNGLQMNNGYIILDKNVKQNTSFTFFISIYFSSDIQIQFSNNAAGQNVYYPSYSIFNNNLRIIESRSIHYQTTFTSDFKNKHLMLWICHDSSRNLYKFGIYSLRHKKCGVRGYIHESFVSKPERARYERVRAF